MIYNIDKEILIWIQENLRNEIMTPIWKTITLIGDKGIVFILITIVLLITKQYRKVGMKSAISLISSLIICNLIIKNVVCRIRPYNAIEDLILIGKRMTDYSFPSGHTSAAFSLGVVLLKNLPKKMGIPVYIFAYLMGFSRLYLGAHYFTDVIVGMILGSIIAVVVMWLYDKYEKKHNNFINNNVN